MIKIISCLVLYCTSVPHCVHGWCHSALTTIFNWSSGRNRTVHRSLSSRIFSFVLQQPVPFWLLRIKGINFVTNFLSLTFGNLKHLIFTIFTSCNEILSPMNKLYKHILLNFAHKARSNKPCLVFKVERYPRCLKYSLVLILYIHFIIFPRKLLFVTIKIHRGLIQKLEKKLTEKNEIWTVRYK